MNSRFHVTPEQFDRQTEAAFKRALDDGVMGPTEIGHLREFIGEVSAGGISPGRKYKLVYFGLNARRYVDAPFHELNTGQLYGGVQALAGATDPETGKRRYKQNTIRDYVAFVKRYCLWLADNGYSRLPMEKIRKVKVPKSDLMTVKADDLLSEDDIRKLIDAAKTSKDRAFISTLYESGCRIIELAQLTWGDVKFDDWCVWVNTAGKTDRPRLIPIIAGRQHLSIWKADYPGPVEKDAFVFITSGTGQPLKYASVIKQLRTIAKRAGVEKHIRGHIFRHSRITHMLQQGTHESIVKKIAWGGESHMLSRYSHLTDDDTAEAMAELAGVEMPRKRQRSKAMEPVQCDRCAEINTPGTEHCRKCGRPLTAEALGRLEANRDALRRLIEENPEMAIDFIAKMKK